MRLLITILRLLPLSVSAGELDGQGIICVNTDERYQTPIGIEFTSGVAVTWIIWTAGTSAKLQAQYGEELSPKYRVSTTAVQWRRYVLDRKTLVLENIGSSGRVLGRYSCDVTSSLDAFQATLELARLELQRDIDASMKDNKI